MNCSVAGTWEYAAHMEGRSCCVCGAELAERPSCHASRIHCSTPAKVPRSLGCSSQPVIENRRGSRAEPFLSSPQIGSLCLDLSLCLTQLSQSCTAVGSFPLLLPSQFLFNGTRPDAHSETGGKQAEHNQGPDKN